MIRLEERLSKARFEPDFHYATQFKHARSGLGLSVTRAYNPNLARWLSRDLIGESGGINLFGYVRNNPISYNDFLGLVCTSCNSPKPEWPYPWPYNGDIGRPSEYDFLECKNYKQLACLKCCGKKFDQLHDRNNTGWCDKKWGPNSNCPDPQKWKCCVDWAVQYNVYCILRCNGSWPANGGTPPPGDPDCNEPQPN